MSITLFDRRTILAAAGASLLATGAAKAAFPDKPIRLLVPFAPGGGTDIAARFIGEKLGQAFNQQVIIDNRPGANGAIAGEAAAKAAPDGYTLLVATAAGFASAPALGQKLPYDVEKDFVPVAMLGHFPLVLNAAPSLPVKTIAEFLAHAKANAGKLNYASAGVGSTNHLVFEMIAQRTGLSLTHVPYRGAALAATDLMSGQMHVMIDSMAASLSNIQAKNLTALAVTTAKRQPQLPDVPTLSESGIDLVYPGWASIVAPAGTPEPVVQQLSAALNGLLANPEVKARYQQLIIEPVAMSPAETGAFMARDRIMLTDLVKKLDIKLQQ